MKVLHSWLREYCDPGLPAEELLALIALRTTDVEGISYLGPPAADGFVVGKVLSVQPHPDADRLSVCDVDTGDGTRTIVCGAPNVAAGQTVPVALPGATMPGGQVLEPANMRGTVSDGMILSEAELQLGEDSAGIAVLHEDNADPAAPGRIRASSDHRSPSAPWEEAAGYEAGRPLADVLPLGEPVLELEVHSNRVDCFGVYGVAREVHAITTASLADPPWEGDAEAGAEGEVSDYASVQVEVPELCPRFTARVFEDVKIAPSPLWLKGRLIAAGQRPINNVVDITNYVMLLCGQPLHAFDLEKVPDGELIVRTATEGEKMTTLDGVQRSFDSDTVLVCDRNGPSGIAGIMGGEVSEVSDSTNRVLLEVASWIGVNILRSSRRLGLRSDASNRFEKQLHPEMALRAQRIASRLLVELCGARMVPGTIDEAAEVPEAREIQLRPAEAERLLGMRIEPEQCAEYLIRLGFAVEACDEQLTVRVPFERHYDVTREVDLIEEVGRIHGYEEHLPSTLPESVGQGGGLTREQELRRRVEDVVRDLGFDAVVSLSLVDPGMPARLRLGADDPRLHQIRVSNPLSVDHSRLRTTLLGSLLDAARYNLAHGAERVALYESGRVYLREAAADTVDTFVGERPPPAHEPHHIACLAVGSLAAPSWRGDDSGADFFTLKGVLEALATQLGADLQVEPGSQPFLHPGRAASVRLGGSEAGWLGELHPLVCRQWDLEAAVGFEIGLGGLVDAASLGREQYEDVISFPAVQQDLAVLIDEDVGAAQVHEAVLAGGGELLRSARVFDHYRGEQVGEGRKSVALRLSFRAPDRTLTDEEVAELRERIRARLADIGGSLRE